MTEGEPPFVLLPQRMAARFQQWAASWGWVDMKSEPSENLVAVAGFSDKNALRLGYSDLFDRGHYMRDVDTVRRAGVWYRVKPQIHDYYRHARMRGLPIDVEYMESAVVQGWRQPPKDRPWLTLAFTGDGQESEWSVWWVDDQGAYPGGFDIVRDDIDPLGYLADAWPVDELAHVAVTVVGVGSIGSAAAEALAATGPGDVTLVDPDRLRHHNLPRHRLTERDLGRHKVTAMCEVLSARHPSLKVHTEVADVARDADLMRPVFAASDVVMCATDGVESRRVANHLARRAGVPIVFAGVLEDGAFGEIVRVRPRVGCLWCLRRTLADDGTLDPEPDLDQSYGTGSPHRPMTAAPHDLRLIGELAAKVAVATILERRGRWSQRLPSDWALIGLQPAPDMPPPFDLTEAGDVRWLEMPARHDRCPTCAPP